jgi:ribulose kinase
MADYLLGIDYGTGGAKACIIDTQGQVLGFGFKEYPGAVLEGRLRVNPRVPRPGAHRSKGDSWGGGLVGAALNGDGRSAAQSDPSRL